MKNAATLYQNQRTPKAGYFREITLLDQQIGRLRKHLRKLGIEKNTLFLYCSDNGGLITESSGGRAKKGSIYEGACAGYRPYWSGPSAFPLKRSMPSVRTSTPLCSRLPESISLKNNPFWTASISCPFWKEKNGQDHRWDSGTVSAMDNPLGAIRIIKALSDAQKAGKPNPHPERILKSVKEFPTFDMKDLEGHAAWNDWPGNSTGSKERTRSSMNCMT